MIEIKTLASGSSGNCYRVTDGSTPILLEAGIPWKKIQQGLDFQTDIAGCLISHEHGDHTKAVKDVVKAGIDIYLSQGTNDALGVTSHRLNIITPLKQFNLGTWTILPFHTQHDANEPIGYLMANQSGEKLLFATDTFYLRYKFVGLTHIMLECNYAEDIIRANVEAGIVPIELKNRIMKSHFSLANVKEFLEANDLSRVREIHLIHLSDDNSNADRFKREIQSLTGKPTYIC